MSGESSVHQLYLATRLPKSTIVRLLGTLVDTGYVSRNCFQHGYNLTVRVQSLSAGYHGSPRLTELGRKLAVEFTRAQIAGPWRWRFWKKMPWWCDSRRLRNARWRRRMALSTNGSAC